MTRYRMVVSDMDETFLAPGHIIPEVNLKALKRMHELGVLFVPSSGRSYPSIMEHFEGLDPSLMSESFVVSFNGGFINRFGHDAPITTCGLDREVVDLIYQRGRQLGMCMHIAVSDGRFFICDAPRAERERLAALGGLVYLDTDDFEEPTFLDGLEVVKALYMYEDLAALKDLGARLAGFAKEHALDLTYSSGRYLEFMPAGVNKGTGLKRLADMLGISLDEVIAVGDSSNDLEMIQAAGLGIGVANVTDDVRPHCDVVLETTGMDGAFGEVVERFLDT